MKATLEEVFTRMFDYLLSEDHATVGHEELKDPAQNPYHKSLLDAGWRHARTSQEKAARTTNHQYTHPDHEYNFTNVKQRHTSQKRPDVEHEFQMFAKRPGDKPGYHSTIGTGVTTLHRSLKQLKGD